MLWDRGTWEMLDGKHSYEKGKLKFRMYGEKLSGVWNLVRMGGRRAAMEGEDNWLLIKERDAVARPEAEYDITEELPNSVESGRTMDQIAAQRERVWHSNKKENPEERRP